jgi:hypothetical protein
MQCQIRPPWLHLRPPELGLTSLILPAAPYLGLPEAGIGPYSIRSFYLLKRDEGFGASSRLPPHDAYHCPGSKQLLRKDLLILVDDI